MCSAPALPHIGLNMVFLVPGATGGMEVYARELVRHLAARGDLKLTAFVSRDAAGLDWGPGVGERTLPVRARRRAEWVLAEQLHLPLMARRAGCELVHSFASTSPLHGSFVRVTTIHDLHYKLVPEAHFGVRALGMAALVPASARRSHRIVVPAASTATDLQRHLGVARSKIDVVHHGLGQDRPAGRTPEGTLRARLELGERPILLSVSAKRPHKNLRRLLDAHALIEPASRPVVVVPGYETAHEPELIEHARALATLEHVRFPHWLEPEDLEGLYAAATAMVFPSLYEGFGLPVIEAMARGVPVACSDRASLPEIAGGAALLFDPEDVGAIQAAIRRLLEDESLRTALSAAGIERAAAFDWDAAAAATVAVYRRALADS